MTAARYLVLHGAAGRMGQSILRLLPESSLKLGAALVRPGSAWVGEPIADHVSGAKVDQEFLDALDPDAECSVLMDFSHGESFSAALELARYRGAAFVSGTTGLNPLQQSELAHAAQHIPVIWSANFSVGVALLTRLVREASRALGSSADVEIVETHHRHKQDAPSGTAWHLGQAVAEGREIVLDTVAVTDRAALQSARQPGEIGFASLRAGDVVGEHTVLFALEGERLTLSHSAGHRDLFARGALRAAEWIIGRPAGLYRMEDVLG
ncbi:MAG: 4-hydroxy-tetrahydrodipicolinate reductase [Ahniella sp.]|nr:4-hydroxy-tetrahydrodipicolinate reductase [Ahniella sp.]